MAEVCYDAKYLVLHFINGQLVSTKVARSWRGALMSKQNHERLYSQLPASYRARYDACTRILPIDAVLAMQGLEKPDTELNAHDAALLRTMGIAYDHST